MASTHWRSNSTLIQQLAQHPDWFDFVQAVRVLEQMAKRHNSGAHLARPVGHDHFPSHEIVRFRAQTSLAFPRTPLVAIGGLPGQANADYEIPIEMVVTFMGLTGPSGVLPQHYSMLLLDQLRDGETALRDFLDLFNHRLISLFYRASTKYQPTILVSEQRDHLDAPDDLLTHAIRSLAGMGTAGHTARMDLCDDLFLYFSGHFSHTPRNAIGLEQMLAAMLKMETRLRQMQGQWLHLEREDQSRLPGPLDRDSLSNQLGMGVVVGERVWNIQSKFRIRVGPVYYEQFRRLMPSGDLLRPLCQFARTYAGPELDFDVQVILLAAEVPACQLGGPIETRLGWNTWLICRPYPQDAEDVVFALPDV